MKVLEVNKVSYAYEEETDLIREISFFLKKNEFISIVGSSGCGKSTLIKIISGIYKQKSGEIKSLKTAYMPQMDLLLPWRNVIENILLPVELNKKSKKIGIEKGKFYLKKFHLEEYEDKLPQDLSGGMRQRVSFIRTLLTEADILLLDEPFSALDAITKGELQEWLLETLKEFNKSVIFITHDINEAIYLSDRILVCKNKPLNSFVEYKLPKEKKEEMIIEIKKKILLDIGGK